VLVRIDAGAAEPLYEQIAGQFRRAIAAGDLGPGDRLPTAKDLARTTGVNVHTVLRAYAELRDAELIELRPRRGAVVRQRGPARARLVAEVRQLVADARRQGLTAAEIIDLVGAEL
jgi:DNA-binding transcriptional regulator YhcF (GntR family)